MGLNSKSSVAAFMLESTEGTPVVPGAATDFIALQDGYTIDPAFAKLENKELRSSIGKAKPILGIEQPKASFDHYLRHSGVEGQAPNFGKILKALFGSQVVASNDRPTVSSSTVALLKVNTGIGADFQRGQPVLVKDGVNGYSIRAVHSVSGDDVTLGFNLLHAPAASVSLGKSVLYAPVNTGHPTLTLWQYRANGGAVEMIAGLRAVDGSFDFNAGEFINGKYSFEGVGYSFNPITVTTYVKLDFLDNATTRAATIAAGTYKTPSDLASALATAMNSLGSANTFTCSYSDTTGKFTFTSNGSTLSLLWNTGTNTAISIGRSIGANMAADQTAALTYEMATALSFAAPYTPTFDSSDPIVAKDNEVLLGDSTFTAMFKASKATVKIANARSEIKDVTAVSGVSGSVVKERTITVQLSALLTQYDQDKFARMKNGTDTRFQYTFGTKSGGNWVPGKCGCVYLPSATITSFKVGDANGLVSIDIELEAYVDSSGNGEIYMGFV